MRKVCGVGVKDVAYVVQKKVSGRLVWTCPYYKHWKKMLERCYSEKFLIKNTTYAGCSVHTEWLSLSGFISWVNSQQNSDWKNCVLDKDTLIKGNKLYGPSTAAFVSKRVNSFLIGCSKGRGKYLLGVSWKKSIGKFQAACNNPFTKRKEFLGYYLTESEAHLAWKSKKHEYARILAEQEKDSRISNALLDLYSPLN